MWQCHYCRLPLPQDVVRKNRLCPNCGSDIHCCKNCVHYDESSSLKCREPHAPWVRDRESQNNCHYFEFREQATGASPDSQGEEVNLEAERAKEAFRALFRNP